MNQSVKNFMKKISIKPILIKSSADMKDIEITHLVGLEGIDKIKEFIEKNQIEVSYTSSPNAIDIMAKGVNKGSGLQILADELKFKKEEIISIGNYYNDIDMFKVSNIGIAIGNAPNEVKEHADYVTERSNNDEGVLEALERFLL